MRRALIVLVVGGLLVSAGYGIGFGADDSSTDDHPTAGGDLDIHHIDVGQGDSTLVITPSGETILIDTGNWQDEGEAVIDYLDAHDIDRIDHLIATHGHDNHIGGHTAVIEQIEEHGDGVGTVYDSGVAHTSESYDDYMDAVRAYNVTLLEVAEGHEVTLENDTAEATVLNPPSDPADRSDDLDYNSIVLTVEYGDVTYLTTGGAEHHAEQRLVEDWGEELRADIYQAGTHGSSSSSTAPFLDAVGPDVAIVSSAGDSVYGHPHDDVLDSFADRGIETYWTGVHGDVVLRTDGETVSVTSERNVSTDPADLLAEKRTVQNESTEFDSASNDTESIANRISATPSIGASPPIPTGWEPTPVM